MSDVEVVRLEVVMTDSVLTIPCSQPAQLHTVLWSLLLFCCLTHHHTDALLSFPLLLPGVSLPLTHTRVKISCFISSVNV